MLQDEMTKCADLSGVPTARDNLNGVGDIRIIGEDALADPGGWIDHSGLKSLPAILVFKHACGFAIRIRKRKEIMALNEVSRGGYCSSIDVF
jgi:hypothetical protein